MLVALRKGGRNHFSDTAHIPSVKNPTEFLEVLTGWLESHDF
ncbi:MAG TPA: hypothetical protein VIJ18_02830 [Microbacteriaceae bacterium]